MAHSCSLRRSYCESHREPNCGTLCQPHSIAKCESHSEPHSCSHRLANNAAYPRCWGADIRTHSCSLRCSYSASHGEPNCGTLCQPHIIAYCKSFSSSNCESYCESHREPNCGTLYQPHSIAKCESHSEPHSCSHRLANNAAHPRCWGADIRTHSCSHR
jgi:hypothetical protein